MLAIGTSSGFAGSFVVTILSVGSGFAVSNISGNPDTVGFIVPIGISTNPFGSFVVSTRSVGFGLMLAVVSNVGVGISLASGS